MRSLLLLATASTVMLIAIAYPQIGILVWGWVAFMSPDRLTFGASQGLKFNLIIAVITILAWLFSSEPKKIPMSATTLFIVLFCLQITLSSAFSFVPEKTWPLWERHIKTFVFIFLIIAIMRNKVRVQAMIWIIALSIGYYGVRNGVYTIFSGGASHLSGPPGTTISDNNHMALALVIAIPMMNYLRVTSKSKLTQIALSGIILLTALGVLGSYSRGGLIGLITIIGFYTIKLRRVGLAIFLAVALVPAITLMPESWTSRMDTISNAEEDSSFKGRLDAWFVSYSIAEDRPLIGGGFAAVENREIFLSYVPDAPRSRAAHSIYFQILGDHGFVGLFLFLAIGALAWNNTRKIESYCRNRPDLENARVFASMAQISLAGYIVSGAALSMAYYDVYYAIVALLVIVRDLVERETYNEQPQS